MKLLKTETFRGRLRSFGFAAHCFLLPSLLLGCGGARTAKVAAVDELAPKLLFVPYIDLSAGLSLAESVKATGQKSYILSFVLGPGGCNPSWNAKNLVDQGPFAEQIDALRRRGGKIIISFGGLTGADLAATCPSEQALQDAYQRVIDRYRVDWVDFCIEGEAVTNLAAIDRRNKAIQGLQAKNPGLTVSLTIPVMPQGLPADVRHLLRNAKSHGVRIDVLNLMTMKYGIPGVDMGQAAIDAVAQTREQLRELGVVTKLGVTPMLGQNEGGEVFSLADTDKLMGFLRAAPDVVLLSIWSMSRDNGDCAGQAAASATCSGVDQDRYAFVRKMIGFVGSLHR